MAAKDFTAKMKKDPHSMTSTSEGKESVEKKPVGRPKVKNGEYKTINISVPVDVLKKMEVAKLKYGNNLTAYVNAVIKADLDANYDKYVELQTLLNS